ncbi:MAG: hypothetical protein JRF33_11630 [Deltaproteobacteria bacterium]|nr:hypothetical protein [Deltaproteobacteria bacterium]
MRWFFSVTILALMVVPLGFVEADSSKMLWPGMSIPAFRDACPGVVPDRIPFDRQLERKGVFHEMEGRWSFEFKDGLLCLVTFSAEGEGVFSFADDEAEVKLAAQYKRFRKKLGSTAKLLEQALKSPPKVTKHRPRMNAAIGQGHTSETLHAASWKQDKLHVTLTLRLLGESGLATDNSDASPLRHVLSVSFSGVGVPGSIPGQKWQPGISAAAFAEIERKLLPGGIAEKGQWGEKATLHGVAGQWVYSFDEGKLDWYTFSRYWSKDGEVTPENFDKGLSAARALIAFYTAKLGKPQASKEKNIRFVDPHKKQHWGYDVIESRWTTPEGKLKVSFDFHGGKGHYFLLLKLGVFKKDYPYFD